MTAPVTIDPRYCDAVIFDLDGAVADTARIDAASAQLADDVPVVDSTLALVHKLRDAGLRTGTCSSGRSGEKDSASHLLEIARRLDVQPGRCVVIGDSEAGLVGGRNGGFALVVGVDRVGDVDALQRSGADAVVDDLAEILVRCGDRRMSTLPDALQSYSQIAAVAAARRLAVLLDFDGTLSAIVDDPDAATLVAGAADALKALAAQCDVAVLSGRDLADLVPRIGQAGIWYAGSDGFELTAPDGTRRHNKTAEAAIGVLEHLATELRDRLALFDGVRVEHKRFAVAVHYRNAALEAVRQVTGAVHTVAQRSGLRVTNGRKVVELRPNIAWDKGKVLEWLLHRVSDADSVLPIYIGDDLTDEDAFDAVRHHGIGIIVRHGEDGDRPSAARFALDGPDAVREFIERLAQHVAAERDESNNPWTIAFGGYDTHTELLREALCTVGNGYFATRGCAPEASAGDAHYPGTYAAGIYNRLTDRIGGSTVDNESLVNLPNWLPLTFRIDAGPWLDIDGVELLSYLQTLDLRRAVLSREFRFRDAAGRTTAVAQRRFSAMHLPHVAALETTVTAENWSGTIEFRSAIHGDVENRLVERYRELSGKHLTVTQQRELSSNSVLLEAATVESQIPVALAARNSLWCG
ncbi:MAG: trehalose-phosphatase, partial [Mycobacterium sp.]|nr:trehalose-phosphatase [Mycobacterium sp.]